jgi:hypothetical protein
MKKFLTLIALSLFSSGHCLAENIPAMVIVLEAPLLARPDWRAPVLQNKRKGDHIILSAGQIPKAGYEQGVAENYYWKKKGLTSEHPAFWETLDRNGNTAYIPKKYVKIIFTDERELQTSVAPFGKDPTDYRLSEPLPDTYPFYESDRRRAVVNLLYGPSVKANYAYSGNFQREEFQAHRGVQLMYLKSVSFDPLERFFFGGLLQISADQTLITFDNDNRAREERAVLGLGPYLSYDVYRDHKNIFTLGAGLNLQWNRHLIAAVSRAGNFEERFFNGLSLRPKLQANYQRRKVFPNVNFVAGIEIESNLPYSLEPSTAPQLQNYWNPNNDTVDVPIGAHFALLIGLTATY